jgi:hypothetical protein
MMPNVEITEITSSRLQAIATPLVDTWDTVITRLIDHWDATMVDRPKVVKPGEPIAMGQDGRTMIFDPASPPQLNFTTCLQIVINDQKLTKGETYWNTMMNTMIREAHKQGHDAEAIYDMLFVNAEIGQKEDNGYKFLADVGISVQGQDSNAAFRQAYQLAKANGISFEVWFKWQDNEKAAHPGHEGILSL